jgi:outer membrane protein assembly factor BamB
MNAINRNARARAFVSSMLFVLVAAGCGGGSGGGSSGGSTPPPAVTLTTLSPSSASAGSAAFDITATGSGFTSSSAVQWNGTALTTNYVSATSLTATVPASDLTTAGTVSVTVSDASSGGASSAVVPFTISTQTSPTISALAPSTLMAGGAAFQLVVTGTNFIPSATVQWDGRPLPTTFGSATQLTAQVTAAQISSVSNVPVTVVNDDSAGGTSNVSTFSVTLEPPAPTLTSLSPSSIPANSGVITLTLTGTNFTSTAMVSVDGLLLSPTSVSPTRITLSNFVTGSSSGSTLYFTVLDPASGDVSSNSETLSITPSIPVASSVAPTMVTAGQGALSLTVTGLYFTSTSVVYFNGGARPTTLNNSGQLVAQLTALDVASAATATITVQDPASGSVASNPISFVIQALPPLTLSSLSPATVPAGNGAFTLTVLGNGFATGSVIAWNGVSLPTTYVSGSTLRTSVTAARVASTGAVPVTVVNPVSQGGTSAPLTLTIIPPSIDAVSYQINNGHSGSITFKSVALPAAAAWTVNLGAQPSYALVVGGLVYVTSSNAEVWALNATTGATVWGPIAFNGVTGISYDAGTIFVTSGTYYSPDILTSLDAANGNTIWSTTIPGGPAVMALPVAAQGFVYTLADGNLTAFNETNGVQVWSYGVSGTNGTVAVTVDGVYSSPVCYAFDLQPAIGSVIWSINTGCEGGGGNTPVVASGRMYAPLSPGYYGGNIYASETGSVLGGFSTSAPPAVSATSEYLLTNSTLQGIALSNNQVNWSFAGDGLLVTAPIVVNNYVFVGSSSGNLYALNASTGAQVWNQNLGAPIPGPATGGSALQGQTGLAAGDGLLIVPAGNTVTAYVLSTNP